jgi:rubrerythrin
MRDMFHYEPGVVSAICSNLSKACTKQFKDEEAQLFNRLALYFATLVPQSESVGFQDLDTRIQEDLATLYPTATIKAETQEDRGVQRALLWGKKVTSIHKSLLGRFQKQQDDLLKTGGLYVCEACGFIAIATEIPAICPICKAPASRFSKIS